MSAGGGAGPIGRLLEAGGAVGEELRERFRAAADSASSFSALRFLSECCGRVGLMADMVWGGFMSENVERIFGFFWRRRWKGLKVY